MGQGEFIVAEADESDGSFLKMSPAIAVVTNIDREHLDHYDDLKSAYAGIRAARGISFDEAGREFSSPVVLGTMMVRSEMADGLVAGAVTTTGEVVSSALRIIGKAMATPATAPPISMPPASIAEPASST